MDINNFVVRINDENREIIKKWWLREFPIETNKAWSVDAHYGKRGGKAYAITYYERPDTAIISFEEFTQYILNNDYQIY